MFDGKAFGAAVVDAVKGHVDRAMAPVLARLEELEKQRSVAGALIDRKGSLILTLSDGSQKEVGPVVGKDADLKEVAAMVHEEAGKISALRDAFGLDDLSVDYDGERTIVLRFARSGQTKEFTLALPVVLDRGAWREGTTYAKGDAVTWAGSLWIAQTATKSKPDAADGSFRLAVKRGRDGKDGTVTAKVPPQPIRAALPARQ
ncbi:hypothetical protein [Roseomonas chloroacetimidivorans]|uniref:hypothetical protein n=1 Tax=Roseomonas chloroacetimidivorans TaxID=1766656 RepID=UPI003C71E612